jgi:hypothetical protein
VDHIAHAVANKDDVDAGFIDDPCSRVVVGRQADQLFTFLLRRSKRWNVDLFGFVGF